MNYTNIHQLAFVTTGMQTLQSTKPGTSFTCQANKLAQQTKSQDESPAHAKKPIRLHTDLAGPISPISREGHKFVINFIDEYLSMIFLYLSSFRVEASSA